MKKTVFSLAVIAMICFTSCKKENSTTNDPTVVETTMEETTNGDYTINKENSVISWTGSKPTGKHMGTISLLDGGFTTEDNKVTGGSFTIDMSSITVTDLEGDDKNNLEMHLKGTGEKESEDHFFNVTKYPTSTFKIVSLSEANGAYFVKGILTMKGIAKEVNFPAEISVNDDEVSLVSDEFKINRTVWNVNYASKSIFDDLKDKFVDDDISLVVKVKATKG
ncbi:YceI family protein [Flavobacterium chuncheonense]|uniref:YceI family protein n=1 Tax=Flavobacterium chuncheonense TaxID=2026653 RepID=A0ABW5YME3_9FLAO